MADFKRAWEIWHPVLVGLLAAGVYYFTPALRAWHLPETFASLLAAAISVGGISIGFLATAKSILISIDDKKIMKDLKKLKRHRQILRFIRSAIHWCFAVSLVSAIGLLVDLKPETSWTSAHSLFVSLWVYVTAGALLASYRIISIFYSILYALGESDSD